MVSTSSTHPHDLQALLDVLPGLSPNDISLIERAYLRAEEAHRGQVRKSKEPYFTHCVAVSGILADMKLDSITIAAGLLHDVVEDTPVTIEDIRSEFGTEVAKLVDGVTKLMHLPIKSIGQKSDTNRTTNKEVEYLRKMMMMMNDDIRVMLVKLADRLHNMRTLTFMSPEKQREIARETMDIFAPLANRLGIWQIKWELEDLSFRYLEPEAYHAIAHKLDEKRADREKYVSNVASKLRSALEAHGIYNTIISARPKHIYSIYRKMTRKNVALEQVYDVRAVRVMVEKEEQCYPVLGIVHRTWRPIPGEFDDYIAAPKDNFYRSLHTAVVDENGRTLEVQIRTREMHEDAEYGIAAHWRYKEGGKNHDEAFEKRVAYLRRLMEFGPDASEDAQSFLERMKNEVFPDRVYAFTPKGDVIDLPMGATTVDFAYHIHTDVGHRCRGAKVNGRLVPLTYEIKTGDQIEIMTSSRGGPSMDWLNDALGYSKTSRAKSKIRHWFKRQNRDKHVAWGREALERELKRLGLLDKISFETVCRLFEYDNMDDFLAAIGAGDLTGAQIDNRVLEEERRREEQANPIKVRPARTPLTLQNGASGVTILGTEGLMVNLARCCNPMVGDPIVGFITRGRGVNVHRADCSNIRAASETEHERLIEVDWGSTSQTQRYTVPVEIIAHDREGLLRDVSTIITDEHVNMSSVEINTRQNIATFHIRLEIASTTQLTRILSKIEGVANVVEAHRRNF